jgi:pyrroline-5-carboxylate reductase
MGGAIARALAKVTTDMVLTDRSGKAESLARELGCVYGSAQLVARCDRIFLAVKPQMMRQALAPLQAVLADRKPLLITMAAGLTTQQIEEMAGTKLPVIRIMPNTPVSVGKGMTQYCANELVDKSTLDSFLSDLRYTGRLDCLPQSLIDAASALSGCGPAYMYMFLEALADGAVECGVPRAKAMEYAAATMAGAAEMVLQTGLHPGALKDAVCSPGGSTIAGVHALEKSGLRAAAMDCVTAACAKSKQLGKS